ncbi:Phage integrase family [Acididesulfobacillus acetoxydans]|uniref:Integrase protein n=1 Tax=Acididesulfobacillus acetoxydans TaxID=1561005 RepID=A0A8S0WMW5_9FIRM|nr:tyrosine-type recombinase/integrase [Acididesulfobacillus acetoxydans]CAA7600834.1 Phage integrase family [Acididesulfobacillus acetoxydans]CEJ09255.1 Integrase protein [Acididesulfobacillus acetoxydans]
MNVEYLRNNHPKLISYMEAAGYSKDYIGRLQKEIQKILAEADSKDWDCYSDVYKDYKATPLSPGSLEKRRAFIGAIKEFDLNGKYPDGKWSGLLERGAYPKLVAEFRSLIDYHSTVERKRGKKESSIRTESQNAAAFLLSLQETGISKLDDIAEEVVMSVFVSPEGERLKSHANRNCISAFLKVCTPLNPNACKKVLSFLPATREARKNIQYLTPQETQYFLDAMDDMTNSLTLRDRAIGKLAYYTGLRSCDIAAMERASIDWECDLIRIKQQKTAEPLELPLSATVGNAIYDYLNEERPSVDCPILFLTQKGPYKGMESANIWRVAARIMEKASIRQSKGDRKGFHIFRHHLATTLLGNGVPQAVISDTLGHAEPESLETYLSADFVHLKECALSTARFPVSEGVFADA